MQDIFVKLDVSPEETIVIEDIPKHVQVANNLGAKTIGFIYPENQHMKFPEYTCLADSASGIKKCIRKISQS